MQKRFFQKVWGDATAFLQRAPHLGWVDLLVVIGLAGLFLSLMTLAGEWTGSHRQAVEINLSPWALPEYVLYSLARGLIAYLFSLAFTLVYGYWAAKDPLAERVLVPLLDILQSIPVLGFMPGLVLALVAIFPSSNTGLELAAVGMIFTGQAWNMTFSFYQSLRSMPPEQTEVATLYRFTWWQRLRWVELPAAAIGLVWNSMMSMAGGWFFLMINEAFVLGKKDFRLPGIGSYMSVAVAKGDVAAMLWAVLAMVTMIVLLDQLLWRPIVVWAQKFRVEESAGGEAMTSWFLDWLRRSRLLTWAAGLWQRRRDAPAGTAAPRAKAASRGVPFFSLLLFCLLVALLGFGAWQLLLMLYGVPWGGWIDIVSAAFCTLGRVLASTAIGTLWALPAGLAIGLSPRLSRVLQPVVQICASFPAPMIFPVAIALFTALGVTLNWGSIMLMLLGTQWYILFNVVAGAMAIPADLREAATSYRITGLQRFRQVLLPAVFSHLVTGWVTAAGGAWNASIVAEYVTFKGDVLIAKGLGAQISQAAEKADFPQLAAGLVTMSVMVVLFNRFVWRNCYRLAERRFSLSK